MRKSKKFQKTVYVCAFALFTSWYLVWWQIKMQGKDGPIIEADLPTVMRENQKSNLKYVLQWTKPTKEPYSFLKEGQDTFIERQCPVSNCYVTWNRSYLKDVSYYNAILFYIGDLGSLHLHLPRNRSSHQRYVFVSSESASNYPYVYQKKIRTVFNLTWTYKLNSDIFYGYISIKNKKGDTIGPKEVMHWPKIEEMKPIDNELKDKLDKKNTAAAWFVSNCRTRNKRLKIAKKLEKALAKYNMTLNIYGNCGNKYCPFSDMKECLRKLERDYYFYLSFENSISEDYVTEKLLYALEHYTVPIVYGGANYTRFMPDGIYLDVHTLNAEEMAKKMWDLINDKEKYYDFFRWRNHYIYEYAGGTPESDYYCNFCKKINDADENHQVSIYEDITKWWKGYPDDYSDLSEVF